MASGAVHLMGNLAPVLERSHLLKKNKSSEYLNTSQSMFKILKMGLSGDFLSLRESFSPSSSYFHTASSFTASCSFLIQGHSLNHLSALWHL